MSTFTARPVSDPANLAADLWDLSGWAKDGRTLLRMLGKSRDPAARLAVAAGLVRHLASDPLLPAALLPRNWPADELRKTYAAYQAELASLTADQD